eukprot:5705496-Amphidinium_carterae.1
MPEEVKEIMRIHRNPSASMSSGPGRKMSMTTWATGLQPIDPLRVRIKAQEVEGCKGDPTTYHGVLENMEVGHVRSSSVPTLI